MAKNTKLEDVDNTVSRGTSEVRNYGKSPFVVKKIQMAKETLQKFPAPEKCVK